MVKTNSIELIGRQKFLMNLSGMWPKENSSIFHKFRNIYAMGSTAIIIIMTFIELVYISNDFNAFSEALSLEISIVVYFIKHLIFIFKKKEFLAILEKLEDPVLKNYPEFLDKYFKRGIRVSRILSNIFQGCCAAVIVLFALKPFFTESFTLVFSFSIVELGNFKYLLHFVQICGAVSAAWNNSCLDLVAVGFMSLGSVYFDVLYNKILYVRNWVGLTYDEIINGRTANEDIISERIDGQVNIALRECIQYHMAVLDFLKDVQNTFSLCFLAQFCNSIVVICNSGFQIVHTSPLSLQFVTMTLYFTSMMTQLALYCYFGNEVMLKSRKIQDACYMSAWTGCGPKVRKSLFIIMEKTKIPVLLSAGKIANVSLEAYASIIRSAYSYFALMQRLYGNELEH